jgi:transposase-like protein
MVRESGEQALKDMLGAEANAQCGAKRYERSPQRVDTRAGHYEWKLLTSSGEVTPRVPRLRNLPFETQIIERYRRRESSVEEGLIEIYLAGVSVRRVEDITEALWGQRVIPSTVSELNQKIYATIEATTERGPPSASAALHVWPGGSHSVASGAGHTWLGNRGHDGAWPSMRQGGPPAASAPNPHVPARWSR